jgi:hypothetical protein
MRGMKRGGGARTLALMEMILEMKRLKRWIWVLDVWFGCKVLILDVWLGCKAT